MGHRIINWTFLTELSPGNLVGQVTGMGHNGRELLTKTVAISTLRVRDLKEKMMV